MLDTPVRTAASIVSAPKRAGHRRPATSNAPQAPHRSGGPVRPAGVRDAGSAATEHLRAPTTGPRTPHATRPVPLRRAATPEHTPDAVKRTVQAAGGIVRGIATGGSEGAAAGIARRFPFKVGSVPGAAIISGGIAAYDTVRELRRSGFSRQTARTAAGGVGGVAGAYQGGVIGASIGAFGGPAGAVVGGAAGALIGGFVGSKVGQGAVDAVAGAVDHLPGAARAVGDAVGGAIDKLTPW